MKLIECGFVRIKANTVEVTAVSIVGEHGMPKEKHPEFHIRIAIACRF